MICALYLHLLSQSQSPTQVLGANLVCLRPGDRAAPCRGPGRTVSRRLPALSAGKGQLRADPGGPALRVTSRCQGRPENRAGWLSGAPTAGLRPSRPDSRSAPLPPQTAGRPARRIGSRLGGLMHGVMPVPAVSSLRALHHRLAGKYPDGRLSQIRPNPACTKVIR